MNKIVTICGSMKYKNIMLEKALELLKIFNDNDTKHT